MKRGNESATTSSKQRKLNNNGSQSAPSTQFEAFGPSMPLPSGNGPLAFDAQLPGLPVRPNPQPLIDEINATGRVEFMFSRWMIISNKVKSRFNEQQNLCIMGTHEQGQTITAVVDGVYPYFYAQLPDNSAIAPYQAEDFRRDCEYDMRKFVENLARERGDDAAEARDRKLWMREELERLLPKNKSEPFYVIDVEYVEKLPVKGYTTEKLRLFKITCRNDKTRRKLARKLQKQGIRPTCLMTDADRAKIDSRVEQAMQAEREELAALARMGREALRDEKTGEIRTARGRGHLYRIEFAKAIKRIPVTRFRPYEADLNFGVQLNTDLKLKVNQWVSFDEPLLVGFDERDRWTDFQIEIHADVSDLVVHEASGKYEKIAPIYQFSYDGEMRAMKPGFPSADESPIIQMGISLRTDITGPAHDYTGILCQGPVGAMQDETKAVSSFTYEAGLLACFVHAKSVRGVYGEVWVGWNIDNFDTPYIYDRLKETFATEFERCFMILKRRGKSDGYIRKLIKVADNAGYKHFADLFVEKDINWILNRLYPFPKRRSGESGSDLKARLARINQNRKDNFTTIQNLVSSVRKSRRARATLAEIGVMPPLRSPSGDGDSEAFYWDLLCELFPDWERMRETGLSAWTCMMKIMSPFRRGMATFRCQNANNAVRDAYNFYEPVGETGTGEWTAVACGQDSVYDASRMFQVYRSFESRAGGFKESEPPIVQGAVSFDGYQVWKKETKRRGYGLKAVYEDIMKTKTAEIDYELIPPYHQHALNTRDPERFPDASVDGNSILTNYCGADARAPLEIDNKKEFGLTYIELGRVTGVDIGDLADRGASIRSTMLIKAEAGEMGMVFPPKPPVEDEGSYQGAYVYEPLTNFYRQPVATLDFSSLYPSIIIAYNLCYSTIIELTEREIGCEFCAGHDPRQCHYRADHTTDIETIEQAAVRLGLGPEDYWTLPVVGVYTVKEHIRKGLLPRVCGSLLAKRKVAKKHLKNAKNAKDKSTKAIDDLLQPLKDTLAELYSKEQLDALGVDVGPSKISGLDDAIAKAEAAGLSTEGLIGVIEREGESREELEKLVEELNTAVRRIPIFNGRQLSFKLCGNSIYGYTGSKTSLIPDRRIALAITTIGMNLILDSASVAVDHMKKGWWAPRTSDVRERFAWLKAYFAICVDVDIAPLATKTHEQELLIRSRLRKGKVAGEIEPFSPQDTRAIWQEPPDPFDMPDEFRNQFKAQMDTQRQRTHVLFKHAYDSKLSPEELGLTESQVKKDKAQKRKLAKLDRYAYGCKMPAGFGAAAPQPMDTGPSHAAPAPSTRSLDARHPPLYRSRRGPAPQFSPAEITAMNDRFERWSELCCWDKNERSGRELTRDDLMACVDTTIPEYVAAAEAFLAKFRTPGAFKRFGPEDCEPFEPPYVYQDNATVVYGDTDSVMVALGENSLPCAHTIGLKLELVLNIFFAPLITLVQEYEKVYEMYYLREKKKRYTGSLFEPFSLVMKYIDAKGSEAARRDNCKVMVKILNKITDMMFVDKASQIEVFDYVRSEFKKIYDGEYDMSQFIITQKFSKAEDDYDNVPAHIKLVEIMRARDPASAPQVGSRIPYVFVPAAQKAKTSERVEDPIYALKHKLPIDYEHYVMNKFQEAIRNSLKLWMSPPMLNRMFSRDLARKKNKKATAAVSSFFRQGPAAPEIVIHNRCSVCKARAVKTHGGIEFAVCGDARCVAKIAERREDAAEDAEAKQASADEIWDICRKCVADNAPGLDIERCANHDCKHWFVRTERQNTADDAKTHLQRIDACQSFAHLF